MKRRLGLQFLGVTLACCVGAAASADTLWDEAVSGDFSNSGLTPTSLTFGLGNNTILGMTGNPGSGIDRDYFSFTVPAGTALTSVFVLNNTSVSGSSSFIGLQAGPQVTVTPTGGGAENLLGFAHYGNDQIGTDLLSLLAPAFPGGLPSGTYSVWVQELGGPVPYGFN